MGFQNGWRGPDIVSDGLVLYLDAGSPNSYRTDFGTTWKDMSGFNNSGSLINGPTYSSANGGSIVFDGVDDYVDCGNQSSIQLIGDMSILSWIKVTDFSKFSGIVAKTTGNIANPYDYYLLQSSGTPNFIRGSGGSTYANHLGTTSPTLGVWQQVAVTMLATQVTHYLNGSSNGTGTISVTTTNAANNLMIGNRSDNVTDFKGNISITQIYNRALSATEIQQNYNAQKSRFGL
jgi:hypothetical protein